mmetsp:Transcript_97314/g.156918  ORF Transcript_97314/g.156918 Transcript_97314/m.156918 type:complete len:87 (+) Transcript_97314:752-1012(+)
MHRLILIEGLTNSQGGDLYQDYSLMTRYKLGLKKLVSLHEITFSTRITSQNQSIAQQQTTGAACVETPAEMAPTTYYVELRTNSIA